VVLKRVDKARWWLGAMLSIGLAGLAPSAQALELLTSIRPLALVAEAIVPKGVKVSYLMPAQADPHSFQLSISDISKIQNADWLVWLGPEFERFLVKPMRRRDQKTLGTTLNVSSIAELTWPESDRAPEAWQEGHSQYKKHTHHHRDPHLWLNPNNGIALAQVLTEMLAKVWPEKKPLLIENFQRFKTSVLSQALISQQVLAQYHSVPFGVSHDGFNHFVYAFNLNQRAAATKVPEERLSTKGLTQLKKVLKGSACLVVEADTPSNKKLARALKLPMVVADPLAANKNIKDYSAFIKQLTQSFVQCLTFKG